MSERISSRQILETKRVGKEALEVVDQTYGSGYPQWTSGHHELAYHNGHHGRAVGEAALKLCSVLGTSPAETAVAETAGYAHDLVQLKGRGIDEAASAQWLDNRFEQTDVLPDSLRRMGMLAIKGTEPLIKNGQLVGQMATEMDYPDRATELVAKSVASSDLGELYTPQGPYLSHQLFREMQGMPAESSLSLEKMATFQRHQIGLLERYQYPLKQAERMLATHRPEVITYSHNMLKRLENGSIETWNELIKHDKAFMKQHA